VILNISVRYKHEISLIKGAKPNKKLDIVRYNREFVITVIVITEFDCTCYLSIIFYHVNFNRIIVIIVKMHNVTLPLALNLY